MCIKTNNLENTRPSKFLKSILYRAVIKNNLFNHKLKCFSRFLFKQINEENFVKKKLTLFVGVKNMLKDLFALFLSTKNHLRRHHFRAIA